MVVVSSHTNGDVALPMLSRIIEIVVDNFDKFGFHESSL